MNAVTRPAVADDLAWVAPAAVRAHLVDGVAELAALHEAEPWRVRVTERGGAALVGRWREHRAELAVLGLWCAPPHVPAIIGDLVDVARSRGFDRLLGPLLPESNAAPYLRAGLRVVERVSVLRNERPGRIAIAPPPEDVRIRAATGEDLDAVLEIDRASFPDFWSYDPPQLKRLLRTGRAALAEREGRAIGYTLATVSGSEGSLGRLAVTVGERGRGTGTALCSEALVWLAGEGVRAVTVSTQSDNRTSSHLYQGLGFRRLPDTLVVCASTPLAGSQ